MISLVLLNICIMVCVTNCVMGNIKAVTHTFSTTGHKWGSAFRDVYFLPIFLVCGTKLKDWDIGEEAFRVTKSAPANEL